MISYTDTHHVKLGDHNAPVPEEEVRRVQDQPLPLRYLPVPLHFHQDLSESSCVRAHIQKNLVVRASFLIPSLRPPLRLPPGGYVFRSCVHPAGVRVEHLRGRHHPPVNNSVVHCHRYVCKCVYLYPLNPLHKVIYDYSFKGALHQCDTRVRLLVVMVVLLVTPEFHEIFFFFPSL